MASKIKDISKFSEDAIQMAFNMLPNDEKKLVEKKLDIVLDHLGKKETKTKGKMTKLTDSEVFQKQIVPRIQQKILGIEEMEMKNALEIVIDFDVKTNFNDVTNEKLMEEHIKIIKLEESLKTLTIVVQFARGMFYLCVAERINQQENTLKATVEKELQISYRTFLRYVALTNIIIQYPRLILCELSFTQILLHQQRMLKFFQSAKGEEIGNRLALSVELNAQGKKIIIDRCDTETIKLKLSTHVDWAFRDQHDTDDLPDDDKIHNWMNKMSGACRGADEERDLEKQLGVCHIKQENSTQL